MLGGVVAEHVGQLATGPIHIMGKGQARGSRALHIQGAGQGDTGDRWGG